MKKLFFLLTALLISASSYSQILNPVKWSYATKKTGDKEAIIYLKATIEKGWHIYSQHIAEGGPVKTTFTFAPAKTFKLNGKTVEPKPASTFEKVFNMQVSYFSNTVIFQQKVNLTKTPLTVKGSIEYMACNDTQCLPPKEESFSIVIK